MSDQAIRFRVDGLPPAKNEALSMLGESHSHRNRVLALLLAARDAAEAQGFKTTTLPISMEVTIFCSAAKDPWDATNYLGGVADVLESKARRGPLAHLGDLAGFALYQNDRQISEVHYYRKLSEGTFYEVKIRELV